MPRLAKVNKSADDAVRGLLASLFSDGVIEAAFAPAKKGGTCAYSLIVDEKEIAEALPFYPLMPANGAGILRQITALEAFDRPVAAVLRPCEIRGFREVAKRGQAHIENILFISSVCPGVFTLERGIADGFPDDLAAYSRGLAEGVSPPGIKPTCLACEDFVPAAADIVVNLLAGGDPESSCEIYEITDKGLETGKRLGADAADAPGPETLPAAKARAEAAAKERDRLFVEVAPEGTGPEALVELYGRCIGCHLCSSACPNCICDLCFFDSMDTDYTAAQFEADSQKKGGARVPADTAFFHLGRLAHTAVSCVGCGQCSDVCPVGIPVSAIFLKVGRGLQEMFDYSPGGDLDEDIPLARAETTEHAGIAI